MKDIGSIFPLSVEDMSLIDSEPTINSSEENIINFSLCREAMYAIAEKYGKTEKKVLIPAYTCQTVIDPFDQQGWICRFYNIHANLRIDTEDLLRKFKSFSPTILVVHPYHGMELNTTELDTLKLIKKEGCILMEDITQCIYSKKRPNIFDYFTGSYRKWYKVPDGGFVESKMLDGIKIPAMENDSFVRKQAEAMYLRAKYFETGDEIIKSISIRLNKEAVAGIGNSIALHKMSEFSSLLKSKEESEASTNIRSKNYNYLYNHLYQSSDIKFVCQNINEVTTAPLYFPIYVSNRTEIQKKLAAKHIYAPVLWPVNTAEVLINDNIKYIYSHILMIPIDQRYDEQDMKKIVTILNS